LISDLEGEGKGKIFNLSNGKNVQKKAEGVEK